MGKLDDIIAKYQEENKKLGLGLTDEYVAAVTRALGPIVHNADGSRVSGSDAEELERVKENFLIKKLGLADSPELMVAINSVLDKMGSSNPNKHRALVYGMLAKHFGKEGIYS